MTDLPAPSPLPLFAHWPQLVARVPTVSLGAWPTPVERLEGPCSAGAEVWLKRDDLSSPVYGGNKVRTLEVLFGAALAEGARAIYSTGAFGSNHAVAAALHAPRVGLEPGALLFWQPRSGCARENLEVTLTACAPERIRAAAHWSALPAMMAATAAAQRRVGERATIMVPGGATPWGALGYVSAALELAEQVARGELPRPSAVVVGVGSTCTSAGLLVGLTLAARAGVGFVDSSGRAAPPRLVSVRVTPWPVTSALRIARLAQRTSRLLAELSGRPGLELGLGELGERLEVDGRFLGLGYGRATRRGRAAMACLEASAGVELDTTYSAKAAAGLLWRARRESGPLLFWSTKSTAALPVPEPARLASSPWIMRRWLWG